jgi:hypothetical protein
MDRRQFLQTLAAGGTLGLAGCTGSDGSAGGSTPTPTATPAGGGTTPTATDTPTPTDSGTTTPTATTTSSGSQPTLGGVGVQFEPNYRFSVEVNGGSGPATSLTGAWNGGNYVTQVSSDTGTVDTYLVDDVTYIVADGTCTEIPSTGSSPGGIDTSSLVSTQQTTTNVQQHNSIVARGRATIDGEEMYVFEIPAGSSGSGGPTTYYVSVATNRLRRVESQGAVIDYFDWGQVAPITAPC